MLSSQRWLRVTVMLAVVGAVLAGCRRAQQGPVTITETRSAAPLDQVPPELGTKARLGLETLPPNHPPLDGSAGSGMPASPGAEAAGGAPLAWTVPAGWTQGPDRPMRLVTFACTPEGGAAAAQPGSPEGSVECYVAELGGMGGGVAANFNRWRGQLGQPPLKDADIAALPRITVLGV